MQKDNFKLFLKFGERSKHEKVCQAIDFKRFLELFQKNGEYCGLSSFRYKSKATTADIGQIMSTIVV